MARFVQLSHGNVPISLVMLPIPTISYRVMMTNDESGFAGYPGLSVENYMTSWRCALSTGQEQIVNFLPRADTNWNVGS